MAAVGFEHNGLAVDVDTAARCGDGAGGLHGEVGADGLAGGNAAEDAAGMVAGEALRREFVAVLAAALAHHVKAVSDGYGFHRVDAHQGVGDVGIQPVKHWFAEADGDVARFNMQFRAHAVQGFAHGIHIGFQIGDLALVGGKEGILADEFFAFKRDFELAHLAYPADDFGAELLAQPFFGHGAGGHAGGGFARRTAAAAAIIADAVFMPIGVVGMAGAELLGDIAVVAAALVGVADEEGDGRAGGAPFKHAG